MIGCSVLQGDRTELGWILVVFYSFIKIVSFIYFTGFEHE